MARTPRRRAAALVLAAAAALAALPARAEEAAALGPFRADEWEIRQGQWRFEPTGELVAAGGSHSAYVLLTGARPRDVDFTVEVMFLTPDSSAGLVLRARGERAFRDTTFYQYEWYTRGRHHDKRLSLMVKNPKWVQIVTPVYPDAPLQRWIRLRVRAQGDLLECFADGKLVFTKRDRRFRRDGRVGLHVFMPRAVRFRGFQLVEVGAKATAP